MARAGGLRERQPVRCRGGGWCFTPALHLDAHDLDAASTKLRPDWLVAAGGGSAG